MITFDDEMKKLPIQRREKIEARTQELLRELKMIREIQERLGLSQENLAVFKLKNGDENLTLGTLASVVSALGGEWEIQLKFPDMEAIRLISSNDFLTEC